MNENQTPKFASLKTVEISDDGRIRDQFIKLLTTIHKMDVDSALTVCEREAMYFKKAVTSSDRLQKCTNISLYSAFLEIAITGLSIQPGSKAEAFLESRGAKQPDNSYINSAVLQITAYGELNMRIRAGQIIRMSNPIVLYDGDHFQPYTTPRGELTVDYKPAIPRKSNTIIGCYVCITLPGNGLDFKWLLRDDVERLRKASARQNGGDTKANALYTGNAGQIDPGFLEAKTIKHALRSYTKLRVGDAVTFEDDAPAPEVADNTFTDPNTAAPDAPETTVQITNTNNEEDIF